MDILPTIGYKNDDTSNYINITISLKVGNIKDSIIKRILIKHFDNKGLSIDYNYLDIDNKIEIIIETTKIMGRIKDYIYIEFKILKTESLNPIISIEEFYKIFISLHNDIDIKLDKYFQVRKNLQYFLNDDYGGVL